MIQRHGGVDACARAGDVAAGAEMWIKVEFERGDLEPWQDAYDRVLALLDIA